MAFHVIGDRTERLFSKGQRLLNRWMFEEAVASFDRALETDPAYAHIHVYKALALAEAGRYEQAIAEAEEGARLDARNFVFPMYLGCIHLDERNLEQAQRAFRASSSLSGTNPLVTSYICLTEYVGGSKPALALLRQTINQMPDAFKSRLMVAIRSQAPQEPDPPHDSFSSEPSAPAPIGAIEALFLTIERRRMTRLEQRAKKLMSAGKYERVVGLLQGRSGHNSDLRSLLGDAQRGMEKDLNSQLEKLDVKARGTASRGRRRGFDRKVHRQRRDLLLRLADLHEGDDRKRYRDLERWIQSFRVDQSSKHIKAKQLASDVLAEMAALARRMGRHDVVASLCEESRSLGDSPEVDWIEAQVQVGNGNLKLARRLFERYGSKKPLVFNERVSAAFDTAAAAESGA